VAETKFTEARRTAIINSIRNGAYAKHAAIASGISERAFYDWCEKDEQFSAAVAQAAADRTNRAIRTIADAGERDWKANAWLLERTSPKDFRENKATEHTGELTLAGLGELLGAEEE
jgi:hypothetical protein